LLILSMLAILAILAMLVSYSVISRRSCRSVGG
jgi:hypothetical protein